MNESFCDYKASYHLQYAIETRAEHELIRSIRERLLEAMGIRLQAGVRVGVFIIGGIDSSVIAGMIAHLVKQERVEYGIEKQLSNIYCYCVGFDEDSGYDESGKWYLLSRKFSMSLGTSH